MVHETMTYFMAYRDNFCWPVRTLRTRAEKGRWQQRTPAMAAGLADPVWSLEEWISFPAIPRREDTTERQTLLLDEVMNCPAILN
jgi:hypothetical protein